MRPLISSSNDLGTAELPDTPNAVWSRSLSMPTLVLQFVPHPRAPMGFWHLAPLRRLPSSATPAGSISPEAWHIAAAPGAERGQGRSGLSEVHFRTDGVLDAHDPQDVALDEFEDREGEGGPGLVPAYPYVISRVAAAARSRPRAEGRQ